MAGKEVPSQVQTRYQKDEKKRRSRLAGESWGHGDLSAVNAEIFSYCLLPARLPALGRSEKEAGSDENFRKDRHGCCGGGVGSASGRLLFGC